MDKEVGQRFGRQRRLSERRSRLDIQALRMAEESVRNLFSCMLYVLQSAAEFRSVSAKI
jgi:hypothetical protein